MLVGKPKVVVQKEVLVDLAEAVSAALDPRPTTTRLPTPWPAAPWTAAL